MKRANGENLDIATCLVGDETGCVNVRITGGITSHCFVLIITDNAKIMQKGSTLAFRNGRSVVFQEHMRLEIDRWGKITNEDAIEIGTVKDDNNLSTTTYETKVVRVGQDRRGGGGRRRGNRRGGDRRERD